MVFTGNTWDSSGVNPEGKARRIYVWTIECITRKHRWGVVWLVCTTAGIQIIVVLLAFIMFSLLPKRDAPPSNCWQQISHTVGCIPANNCQAVNRFVLFTRLDRVLFSIPEMVSRASSDGATPDLSARAVGAGRLLIARSMNNITGPTDTRTGPGYKLNCARRGTVGGARDFSSML